MMDMSGLTNQNATSAFSIEQGKAMSLVRKLQGHENKTELMKTARQFEGVFVNQLLTAMDKTVDRSSGILNGGSAEDTFRGMLYEKISDMVASRPGGSGFGLAEAIYKQMSKNLPSSGQDGSTSPASGTKLPQGGH